MDSYNNHLQDHMFSNAVAGSLQNSSHAQDLDIDHVQHNLNAYHPHHQQNSAFNARSSFNSYPNTTRLSISTGTNPRLAYTNGGQSHLTSPTMSHMQFMDPRASLDGYANMGARQAPPPPATQGHVLPGSQIQISSQTPYGPHVASGPTAAGMLPAGVSYLNNAPPHGSAAQHPPPAGQQGPVQHEEISTIFVVGFPDDMQEREFQNMFTFSSGFEAATLKIPNKESTSYGAGANASTRYAPHNDPYNLVTVNQGGVVVDGGRDGTVSSWPPVPEDAQLPAPQPSNNNTPQRKQIIGFAKFRTREEAISARDALQGRRVDMEKGSVLKAEMAKKNLHTKRGVGIGTTGYSQPPSSNPAMNSAAANLLSGGLQNVNNLPMMPSYNAGQDAMFSAALPGGGGTEVLSARERELGAIGAMGLGSQRPTWREMHKDAVSDDERGPMSLNMRGMRDQAQDDIRRVNGVQDAFRAMTALSPTSETNGYFHNDPLWAKVHSAPQAKFPPRPPSSSRRSTSPETSSTSQRDFSPPDDRKTDMRRPSQSSASSVSGSVDAQSTKSATGLSDDESMARGMRSLALNVANANAAPVSAPNVYGAVGHDTGATSPQLPSPGSSSASTSTRHSVDANPPINTLYVGNLPSSVTGHPPEHLEDSLKALFAAQPGYRRLCFRQKSNGPMCFVEFEDVSFATKALNDLYGHTLDGLVKAPGIRLSYSKNPLGVRTPTSAGSNGSSLQQQQQTPLVFPPEAFAPRGDERRRDATVSPPPVFGNNYMGSPPPRFSSPNYGGSLPASNFSLGGAMYGGFSNGNNPSSFANFSLATPQLGSYNEQAPDMGRPLSPQHTIEATRAA
ncbi:hypothetical protein K523DRAFT_101280 [Schizophyllum commune Tattone D]|nr:hypothetical protein K523DRAFT_101280 [Schizophyllum commune Tattone D]